MPNSRVTIPKETAKLSNWIGACQPPMRSCQNVPIAVMTAVITSDTVSRNPTPRITPKDSMRRRT